MTRLTRSYTHGASDQPLLGETIGETLDRIADRASDVEALVVRHQRVRWTYGELRARVNAWAAGLVALGLELGDRFPLHPPGGPGARGPAPSGAGLQEADR